MPKRALRSVSTLHHPQLSHCQSERYEAYRPSTTLRFPIAKASATKRIDPPPPSAFPMPKRALRSVSTLHHPPLSQCQSERYEAYRPSTTLRFPIAKASATKRIDPPPPSAFPLPKRALQSVSTLHHPPLSHCQSECDEPYRPQFRRRRLKTLSMSRKRRDVCRTVELSREAAVWCCTPPRLPNHECFPSRLSWCAGEPEEGGRESTQEVLMWVYPPPPPLSLPYRCRIARYKTTRNDPIIKRMNNT